MLIPQEKKGKGIFLLGFYESLGTHGHRDGILWRTWLPNCIRATRMGTGRSLGCGVGMMRWLTPLVSPMELIQQRTGNPLHLKSNEKQWRSRRRDEV